MIELGKPFMAFWASKIKKIKKRGKGGKLMSVS